MIDHKSNWLKFCFFLLLFTIFGYYQKPVISNQNTILPKIDDNQVQIQATTKAVNSKSIPVVKENDIPKVVDTNHQLSLKIEAIKLSVPLSKTTLDSKKALIVPPNPSVAAWYKNGPKPGDPGSALITGHFDSSAGPGVFYSLRRLKSDDLIEIRREDGRLAIFRIVKLESYPQDYRFPWNKVYSTSGPATIRLITCDGTYNGKTGKYDRNLVVYATLVSIT